jgi:hypothetical protein
MKLRNSVLESFLPIQQSTTVANITDQVDVIFLILQQPYHLPHSCLFRPLIDSDLEELDELAHTRPALLDEFPSGARDGILR